MQLPCVCIFIFNHVDHRYSRFEHADGKIVEIAVAAC
jgi:hypothetical protein